jgi:CheY-like chemotaxis protein
LRVILAIEDSPAIALLLRRRLELAGYSVEMSPNGLDAIELLEDGLQPDLVMADVMMPGIDGLETLTRIRQMRPGTPVVLVTGQDLHPLEQEKADAVFPKPIDFEALLREIARLCDRVDDAPSPA